jgi:hypothetical protein
VGPRAGARGRAPWAAVGGWASRNPPVVLNVGDPAVRGRVEGWGGGGGGGGDRGRRLLGAARGTAVRKTPPARRRPSSLRQPPTPPPTPPDNFLPNGHEGTLKGLKYFLSYQPRWDMYGRMLQRLSQSVPVMTSTGNHEVEFQSDGTVFAAYNSR